MGGSNAVLLRSSSGGITHEAKESEGNIKFLMNRLCISCPDLSPLSLSLDLTSCDEIRLDEKQDLKQ
jgi:hypothetical protein